MQTAVEIRVKQTLEVSNDSILASLWVVKIIRLGDIGIDVKVKAGCIDSMMKIKKNCDYSSREIVVTVELP